MQLEGKVALITGGGTGIGAATARRYAGEGAHVIVMGRRVELLEQVAAATGGVAFAGDAAVTSDARRAVETAVERFGGLDIVVANAGGHVFGTARQTDDAAWAEALHSNLGTAFVLIREALPALIERKGVIIIISSIAGVFAPPGAMAYTTTKHALIGLTRSLTRDYGPKGVRVNAVCPGWVRTAMSDEQMDVLAADEKISREEAYLLVASHVPLRRPGEPEEIAAICTFLASKESSLMTGAVLMADGGAGAVDMPTIAFEHLLAD